MSVSVKDLEKIAQLARLNLSEEEKKTFLAQFNDILGYVEKLSELDTEGVEPLAHSLDLQNVMREDKEKPSLDRDKALQNAPSHNSEFFRVPKVVSK